MAAARFWAGGGPADLGEAADDAARFGLGDIAGRLAAIEPPLFEVWPENMPVVDTFLTICNQWDTIPLADGRVHHQGLDYGRVQAGLALAGRTVSPLIWAGVQVMERAAAAVLNGVRG